MYFGGVTVKKAIRLSACFIFVPAFPSNTLNQTIHKYYACNGVLRSGRMVTWLTYTEKWWCVVLSVLSKLAISWELSAENYLLTKMEG